MGVDRKLLGMVMLGGLAYVYLSQKMGGGAIGGLSRMLGLADKSLGLGFKLADPVLGQAEKGIDKLSGLL